MIAILAIIAISLTITTYGAISATHTISSSGSIATSAGLGVYYDYACTNPITSVNWGSLSPGSTAYQTVYVKNTGSGVSLVLDLDTSSWAPSGADGYLTVNWDKTGVTLSPGQSVQASISLYVAPSITGISSFSVQILITGSS